MSCRCGAEGQKARARRSQAIRDDMDLQARMAAKIASLFPECPTQRAHEIARHAAARGRGRVSRSGAGRRPEDGVARARRRGIGPPSRAVRVLSSRCFGLARSLRLHDSGV